MPISPSVSHGSAEKVAPPISVRERPLWGVAFAFLLLTSFGAGVVLSILGPTAPAIATRLGVREAALGALFTASYLAATLATIVCGALFRRVSGRVSIPVALAAMTLGLVAEGTARALPLVVIGAALTGTGIGIINVYVNATAVRLYPQRRETVLTVLGVCFGVGAFATPLSAAFSLSRLGGYAPVYLAGAVTLALPILPLIGWLPRSAPSSERASVPGSGIAALLRDRNLRLLMAIAALYLGAQVGFGGWVVSIVARMTRLAPAQVAPAASAFWFCQAAGGALAVVLLKKGLTPRRLIANGAIVAAASSILLVALGHVLPLAVACCALVGLAFAPILPMTMSLAATGQGDQSESDGSRLAAIFTTGQAGAAIIPSLQGALLATNAALPLWFTALCGVGVAALATAIKPGVRAS